MQRNKTSDTLIFEYTIANLDYDYEPFYGTHISTDQLIQNVLQNYLSNETATKRSLQVGIIRLMFENTKLHSMIDSEDDDISQLAIQMLFDDHLDIIINWMQRDITIILYMNILKVLLIIGTIDIKNIAIEFNEGTEYLRGNDLPDCKKYKELLESEDKEVIRFAIELLIIDGVEKCQINRCKEKFLHEYRGDQKGFKNIVGYEPKHNNSVISIVI